MYFRRTLTFPSPTLIITVSRPEDDLKKSLTEATSTSSSCRLVSFDTSHNTFHETTWSKKSCKARWYGKKQIKQFKDDFFSEARERREATNHAHVAYQKVMLAMYDECCVARTDDAVLSSTGEYMLKAVVTTSGHHRCGMERISVKEIEYDKRQRRVDLLQAVFDAHQAYTAGSVHARTELVRRASLGISRPARLFARHVATALGNSLQQTQE